MDGSENRDFNLIGIGLYTVAEAARLTGISDVRLRGWLRGYAYRSGEVRTTPVPVWRRQVPEIDGTLGLGFLDLMEARFVDAFRAASVPWRVIRLCAERAREVTGRDHPFSSRRFRTDGRTIFADVVDHAGEQQLLDLAKNQAAFARVIGPSLYAGLEFSVDDIPPRWWPMGSKRGIVIDPKRSFGQPIVSDGGVPTTVLWRPKVLSRRSHRCLRCRSIPCAQRFAMRSGLLIDLSLEGLFRSEFIPASCTRLECSARPRGRSDHPLDRSFSAGH